jgi:FKBP-type peptidyl-prolyl cis-trans isomerase SlyD
MVPRQGTIFYLWASGKLVNLPFEKNCLPIGTFLLPPVLLRINNCNLMQITKNKVAAIHYTLRDNKGTVIDTSDGREPLYYLHGAGNLIMGMEEGLEGKGQGAKLTLKIAPEKGYGQIDPEMIQKVPRSAFGDQEVKKGMKFSTNQGGVVTVTDVGLENITVDANHPLAGVELNFDVEVVEVRNATEEELSHGHVHGPGGHHH